MSDEAAARPTESDEPQPLVVNVQYVKDLSFENPNAPGSLVGLKGAPDIHVDVDVAARGVGDNTYEVTLTLRAHATSEERTVFLVDLIYGGVLTLTQVPDNAIEPILMIEAPRLLFPYARNIVSDATRNGGFPPLLVNPIDFAGLYRNQLAKRSTETGSA